MKIAIITFLRAYNYGAVLQAYALNKAINDLGAECQVIDYYPRYFYNIYSMKSFGSFKFRPCRSPKIWYDNNSMYYKVFKRKIAFSRFIREHINITKVQYHTADELINCEEFDAYISGSDQVWNPYLCDFDQAYYLAFCLGKKRYSYAASFGLEHIPEKFIAEYKKRLKGWDKYSVREKVGIELVRELTGEKAECVCDPTLLLSRDKWESIVRPQKRRKPYILLYFVNNPNYLMKCAKKLLVKYGFEVICLHSLIEPDYFSESYYERYGFKCKSYSSPLEFVEYIKNAQYIITDAFHGTVFSVLFHKSFLSQTKNDNGVINERIVDFLNELSLSNKTLDYNDLERINLSPNWEAVDVKLEEKRNEGIIFLKDILIH